MIKVIIADDEEKVCQLIYSLIDWKSLDMEVVGVAHDGIRALELIESFSPNIVITDIRMPGYDGLELISLVKELNNDLDFIIISGYRHFEYAQSAIKYGVCDYLLKPIKKEDFLRTLNKLHDKYMKRTQQITDEEQLRIRLKGQIGKIRSSIFTEVLLQKGITTEDIDIDTINNEYHFNFCSGSFQVIAVKIDCGFEEFYESGIKILEEKTIGELNKYLKEYCFDMEIYFENSVIFCILNYAEENKKILRKQLKVVLNELVVQKAIFEQFEFTIGMGSVVDNIKNLKESFRQSKFAYRQRLILGTGALIEDVEIYRNTECKNEFIAFLNKAMGSAIEVLDKEAVLASISEFKDKIKDSKSLSGQDIFELGKEACSLYLNHIKNNQLKIDNASEFYDDFALYSNRCSNIEEMFGCLFLIVESSLNRIIEDKKHAHTKPIRTAKQYIQKNYMSSISLEEVSGVVGFNPSYFSSMFKKECGINFLEYISEVRMNKAKELLRETTMSIASICEEVGYNDLKHFTKSFKKNTGIKPNEYRKLYS